MAFVPFRFLDNRGRARFAVGGLCLGVLARLGMVCWLGWVLLSWGRIEDGEAVKSTGGLLDSSNLAALVIGAVFFLRWFRRAYENAMALGMRSARGPGWAIGAWFVPVVNMIEPSMLTNAMWRHAGSHTGTQRVGGTMLPGMWWFCWIVPNIVTRIVSMGFKTPRSAEGVQVVLQILLACYLVNAVSGILGIVVVRKLTRAQAEMHSLHGVESVFGDADPAGDPIVNVRPIERSSVPGERLVEGSSCGACGGNIALHTEASVCTGCDLPFHDVCLAEGACPKCRSRELDVGFQRW